MSFSSRSDFINAQSSEKVTLAHVEATSRVYNWTLYSGNIYSKVVPHYVIGLKEVNTARTEVSSIGGLISDTWFYEADTSTLYVNLAGTDPDTTEMIATYRFFYANSPVSLSYDLTDTGTHVYYDARIKNAPGFKHKLGIDQKLTSVIGQGNLVLENTDAALDDIYDTVFFENQNVTIYSWNRELNFSDAKKIYKGKVTNKSYTPEQVTLKIKDGLYDLLQPIPQTAYDDTDNVNGDIKGRYKRWIYGRVDGLQLQSIDQIGDGYTITGTATGLSGSATITGSGTSFLSDVSPGDTIIFGTQEFKISSVATDTSLTLDDQLSFGISGSSITLKPEVSTVTKNRIFLVAGHACSRLTKTLSSIAQLNRVVLNNVDGLIVGDFIEFATAQRLEIKDVIVSTNTVVLRNNLTARPSLGSNVTRQPVQNLYIESEKLGSSNFTITNNSTETKVILTSTAEYDLAPTVNFGFSATFTNGTRTVNTSNDIDLTTILKPRDYIKPDNVSYSTFYEILAVDTQSVTLRANFTEATTTDPVEGKKPNYIDDKTIISANVIGRTEDNDPDGTWIKTSAKATQDILSQLNITDINTSSFTDADSRSSQTISIAIPLNPTGQLAKAKDIIDLVTRSTYTALTLDNNLDLQYRVLLPEIDDNITTISDEDVINWSIESVNGDLIRNSLIKYRHKDIDRYTLEAGNNVVTYSSAFVQKYIGTNTTDELDAYLYNATEATTLSHREVYYRSLSRSTVKVVSDLRLENLEIGDSIIVDFDRMYKRLGDTTSRKKVCVIVGKTVTGNRIELILSDFGNIMNRSSIITPNAAPDFTSATEEEKIKYGYITDNNGIINDDENTANTKLIS